MPSARGAHPLACESDLIRGLCHLCPTAKLLDPWGCLDSVYWVRCLMVVPKAGWSWCQALGPNTSVGAWEGAVPGPSGPNSSAGGGGLLGLWGLTLACEALSGPQTDPGTHLGHRAKRLRTTALNQLYSHIVAPSRLRITEKSSLYSAPTG